MITGDPQHDFFEQNPELRYISEFSDLIDSLGQEAASTILWCTYMLDDPKSKIFNMPRVDKVTEVKEQYYKDYDEEKYKEVSKVYAKVAMEKEEWLYSIHIEKLDMLTGHLDKLDLEKDKDFTKYVRIMDKLPKIWDALEKVKARMIAKTNKSGLRGGARRSAREKR
jgi:hypothetical protein